MANRVALPETTILDRDTGNLPVTLYDANGNYITPGGSPVSTRTVLHALGTEVGGQAYGPIINVGNATELLLINNITAISGTSPSLYIRLDVSDDGGTTFYSLFASDAINSVASWIYTIGAGFNAAAGYSGPYATIRYYPSSFGDTLRYSWQVAGTGGPTCTFKSTLIAKG